MMGLLGRIAGPKVLLGVVVASGLAILWLWWSYSDAAAEAAAARSRAEQEAAAAESARQAAATWRRNAEAIAEVLGQRQRRERDLRAELANTQDRLQEARADASEEVQRCLDLTLPSAYVAELRAADGDQGGDPDAGAAAGAD